METTNQTEVDGLAASLSNMVVSGKSEEDDLVFEMCAENDERYKDAEWSVFHRTLYYEYDFFKKPEGVKKYQDDFHAMRKEMVREMKDTLAMHEDGGVILVKDRPLVSLRPDHTARMYVATVYVYWLTDWILRCS